MKTKGRILYKLMAGSRVLIEGSKSDVFRKYNNYLELGLITKLDMYIKEVCI
jgi:hypothetical protein